MMCGCIVKAVEMKEIEKQQELKMKDVKKAADRVSDGEFTCMHLFHLILSNLTNCCCSENVMLKQQIRALEVGYAECS
jgi:hypothetical protein